MKNQLHFISARKIKAVFVGVAWGVLVVGLFPACASRSQFQKGYERGASDTVKRQYWILQNMQKREEAEQSKPRISLYRMPIAPDPASSVKTVPYEITLPIYE